MKPIEILVEDGRIEMDEKELSVWSGDEGEPGTVIDRRMFPSLRIFVEVEGGFLEIGTIEKGSLAGVKKIVLKEGLPGTGYVVLDGKKLLTGDAPEDLAI